MALRNGTRLGPYEITSRLGAGGMGEVYTATDTRLGRLVAIKVLPDEVATDEALRQRFEREARTISRLNHPNICTLHDIGDFDGRPFIVMEVVEGDTLQQLLARGQLDRHRILDLSIQLADALDTAHRAGVIHRDIKPANIIVGSRGQAKLLDFGLAKLAPHADVKTGTENRHAAPTIDDAQLTQPRMAVGTIAYMSPEQARGEELDHRTDIFSMGAVIYEMVTGQRAFPGQTSAVIFDAILNHAPTPPLHFAPDAPARLGEIIRNAIEKQPDLRYQSAADLKADLLRSKRDLDSGQSVTLAAASVAVSAAATGSAPPGAPSAAQASSTAGATGSPASSASTGASRGWLYGAFGVVVAAILAIVFLRPAQPPRMTPDRSVAEVAVGQPQGPANLPAAPAPTLPPPAREEPAPPPAAETPEVAAPPPVPAPTRTTAPPSPPDDAVADGTAERAENPPPPPPPRRQPESEVATVPVPGAEPAASNQPDVEPPAPPEPEVALPPVAPPPAAVQPTETEPVEPAPIPTLPETPPGPTRADDEAAIRKVLANFERAIESKDMGLYRATRSSLSLEDERRVRAGFEAVDSQEVSLDVQSIDIEGDRATVSVSRVDTIRINGRSQTQESMVTMRFGRQDGGWVIMGSN